MTIGDRVLIVFVIVITIFITFLTFVPSLTGMQEKRMAVISFQGKEYGRYLLDENRIISISKNIELEVNNNRIKVLKNNCPQGICIHRKWINKPGQIICCVPNKLLVKIVARKKLYDGLTY